MTFTARRQLRVLEDRVRLSLQNRSRVESSFLRRVWVDGRCKTELCAEARAVRDLELERRYAVRFTVPDPRTRFPVVDVVAYRGQVRRGRGGEDVRIARLARRPGCDRRCKTVAADDAGGV